MAGRGPVPKRLEERLGHVTRGERAGVATVVMAGAVEIPDLPKTPKPHPVAVLWYESLAKSGQGDFFEPSDWAAAVYVATAITKNLRQSRFSAELFGQIWKAMNDMLTTEAGRRRARLQVQRVLDGTAAPEQPTAIEDYRKALGG